MSDKKQLTEEEKKVNEFKIKGNKAFKNREYDDAIKFYTAGLKINPNSILILSNRSVAYSKYDENECALKDAEKVISLRPKWPKGYLRKGMALIGLEKYKEAIESLEEGLTHDPENELLKKKKAVAEAALKREKSGSEEEGQNNFNSMMRRRMMFSRREVKTETKRTYTSKEGIKLEICIGDITKENVGAICNAANGMLMLGGGVAGAISRAGGDAIQEECDLWTDNYGRVSSGECGLSSGGNMVCKYVIHAVGPVWSDGHEGEDKELLYAVYNSMLMAHQLKLDSISSPAISSGIFGFPKKRCAKIMFHSFFQFVKNFPKTTVKSVRFTNFDNQTVGIFEEEFETIFGEGNTDVKEGKISPKVTVEEIEEKK